MRGGSSLPPFEHVVREHGAVVLRVCAAVVGRGEAEEVWSETFLAALAAYPRLRPDSNVRAWLLAIARNKGIDLHRDAARRPLPVEQPRELDSSRSSGSPPVGDGPEQELLDALAALPERQRAAIGYHHVAELPYSEVAKLLNSSEAAARRSAADGMATLRRRLGKERS